MINLAYIHFSTEKDFFQLSFSEVNDVLLTADACGYRKPKNANGSRARYFYEAVKRKRARR